MRIRHESLAASTRAGRAIEANRSTLRESILSTTTNTTAQAKGARRASELALLSADASEDGTADRGQEALANHVAAELLLETAEGGSPGLEEWLKEVRGGWAEGFGVCRAAVG